MKLYGTLTSERASKGQGGNKEIAIVLNVGSAKDSRPVALLKIITVLNGGYELFYRNIETDETKMLQHGYIDKKGKKQKGDYGVCLTEPKMHNGDIKADGYCGACGQKTLIK